MNQRLHLLLRRSRIHSSFLNSFVIYCSCFHSSFLNSLFAHVVLNQRRHISLRRSRIHSSSLTSFVIAFSRLYSSVAESTSFFIVDFFLMKKLKKENERVKMFKLIHSNNMCTKFLTCVVVLLSESASAYFSVSASFVIIFFFVFSLFKLCFLPVAFCRLLSRIMR